MRKRGHDEEEAGINTLGWMMSYADMATTLLAMFIALSVLGKDQTGISLYNGTGSYVQAVNSFGLPGLFARSQRVVQLESPGPHYLGPDEDDPKGNRPSGQDKESDDGRIVDAEAERLQRFFGEMTRQFEVEKQARRSGRAVVDFFDRFNRATPMLPSRASEVLGQVLPLLQRDDYRVFVVVWASMPSNGAWNRAAAQARAVVEEVAGAAQLDAAARGRFIPLGQPWRYANYRRPVMSLVIVKSGAAG